MRHEFLRRPPTRLAQALRNVTDVTQFEQVVVQGRPLLGLREAIPHVEELASLSFWTDVFPTLCKWLTDKSMQSSIPLLLSGTTGSIEFTNKQVRAILAHAFCFNCLSTGISQDGFGVLDFSAIFSFQHTGTERTKCLLLFFIQEIRRPLPRKMSISRWALSDEEFPDWKQCDVPIYPDVRIQAGRMEDCLEAPRPEEDASEGARATIVDFANKQIHIGQIIPSVTQEELIFSCASECFLTLLTCECMKPNEVVLIQNVRRAIDYQGYLHTFRVTSMLEEPPLMDVLVIDACFREHFASQQVIRDLHKAWLGFSKCAVRPISTGHWGCGAFGGNETHKFLQQLCAGSLVGAPMEYSTFHDDERADWFRHIHSRLLECSVSVKQVVQMMLDYNTTKGSFEGYCNQWLKHLTKEPSLI